MKRQFPTCLLRHLTCTLILLAACRAMSQDLISDTDNRTGLDLVAETKNVVVAGPSNSRQSLKELEGTWLCVEALRNGKSVDNFVGVRAVMQGNSLTWIYPQRNGNDLKHACRFTIDATRSPRHFDWHLSDQPTKLRRRLYKIENGMLYWATNQSATRPAHFDDAEWIFRCRRTGSASVSTTPRKPVANPSFDDSVSWGKVIDPDNDCRLAESGGKVTIEVPAGLHSLWCGVRKAEQRFNAPRVMKTVTGDFVMKVRMSANWHASGLYTRSAGLLIWDSEDQYLKHDRCQFTHARTRKLTHFTTPQYDLNFKRTNDAKTTDKPGFFQGNTTWLLMQRKGQMVYTWIGEDGKNWQHTGSVRTEFPQRVQVGIFAGSRTPDEELNVVFDNLVLNNR